MHYTLRVRVPHEAMETLRTHPGVSIVRDKYDEHVGIIEQKVQSVLQKLPNHLKNEERVRVLIEEMRAGNWRKREELRDLIKKWRQYARAERIKAERMREMQSLLRELQELESKLDNISSRRELEIKVHKDQYASVRALLEAVNAKICEQRFMGLPLSKVEWTLKALDKMMALISPPQDRPRFRVPW